MPTEVIQPTLIVVPGQGGARRRQLELVAGPIVDLSSTATPTRATLTVGLANQGSGNQGRVLGVLADGSIGLIVALTTLSLCGGPCMTPITQQGSPARTT